MFLSRTYIKFVLKKLGANLEYVILGCIIFFVLIHKTPEHVYRHLKPNKILNDIQERFVVDNDVEEAVFWSRPSKSVDRQKIDWHNYTMIGLDKVRFGLGEHGVAVDFTDEAKLLHEYGYNEELSDMIAMNRSLPDVRDARCLNIKYYAKLPTVSVIIPFFDERASTLLRAVYSVVNRSPANLLLEIILVNDHSTKTELHEPLEEYVAKYLPLVKIIRRPGHLGQLRARVAGAEIAIGDVIVFLDAHTEVNVNWLPPLLEPIADNYKVCMCPIVDSITAETFEYTKRESEQRGSIDWSFNYVQLEKADTSLENATNNYATPIMAQNVFAISRKFFLEMGGYDEGFDTSGGEQFEISMKIWMCGGEIYNVPCSRIGHISRNKYDRATKITPRNMERIVEVWMEEYKEIVYAKDPFFWTKSSRSDISAELAIRDSLECKPFSWFLNTVLHDFTAYYPLVELPSFATGAVQFLGSDTCIDTMNRPYGGQIGPYQCSSNIKEPHHNQYWTLGWRKDIRSKSNTCWYVDPEDLELTVKMQSCVNDMKHVWGFKNNHITYDNDKCLVHNEKNKTISVKPCDDNDDAMKWTWGFVNETRLAQWDD